MAGDKMSRKIEDCNNEYSKLCGIIGDLEVKKALLLQEVAKLQVEAAEITKLNDAIAASEAEKNTKKTPVAEATGAVVS
jgi:hypothetical protein